MTECPVCYPRPVCERCARTLDRGICMAIFHVMESMMGAAIAFAAISHSYVAMCLFAFVAFLPVFLVIEND